MQVYMKVQLFILAVFIFSNTGAGSTDLDWWQEGIVYQIYPRSFQDSNGDGVGDLKGITQRIDYLKYIGIGAIWLSPMYTSPMKDFGYDIANHTEVDPIFGTLQDLDELIEEAHRRDIKVILDFVPNHTSDLHPWFIESRKGGENNPYSDYYVWNDGVEKNGKRLPPNNWLSVFGGSMWQWDEGRQQFYLHQFVKEQPDLNYRNPKVQQDMKKILEFWCERGVDGFRVDAIGTLYEEEHLEDEPKSNMPGVRKDDYDYLLHVYTSDQDEIHDVIPTWREVLDQCGQQRNQHIFMVMEIYDELQIENMKYYFSGADMPFNFNFITVFPECYGACIKMLINTYMDNVPRNKWPNFVLGNHDRRRITTRKGLKYASVMNMLLLTLPGTPTTYYGEEIGQRDITVSFEDTQDPWGKYYGPKLYEKYSRDPCRAPMQWTSEKNAGFSTADKTWLPVHEDYTTRNVDRQIGDRTSILESYVSLAKLRLHQDFQNAKMKYVYTDEDIISYLRKQGDDCGHLVILNVGENKSTQDYSAAAVGECGTTANIVETTADIQENLKAGTWVPLKSISTLPGEGIVLRLQHKHSEL